MNLLHICSYYPGSKVHKNLFHSLALSGVTQHVHIPSRIGVDKEANKINSNNITFSYSEVLSIFTRFFFILKIILISISIFNVLKNKNRFDIIHAHTLYTDGVATFLMAFFYKIPFILTIRNTDVNFGFKYIPHYNLLIKVVLRKANKIIFLSPSHKKIFNDKFGQDFDYKIHVIPNGIDNYFIDNSILLKPSVSLENNIINVIYVGAINKNKNIKNVIKALATLDRFSVRFTVIGGTYDEYRKVYGSLKSDELKFIDFIPQVSFDDLLKYYAQANLFCMVSHTETFGLVYIEAISQCVPIVYTEGQGIDGYFVNGEYGFKCDSKSVGSIHSAIINSINKFPNGLGPFKVNPAVSFSWRNISKKYVEEIYT